MPEPTFIPTWNVETQYPKVILFMTETFHSVVMSPKQLFPPAHDHPRHSPGCGYQWMMGWASMTPLGEYTYVSHSGNAANYSTTQMTRMRTTRRGGSTMDGQGALPYVIRPFNAINKRRGHRKCPWHVRAVRGTHRPMSVRVRAVRGTHRPLSVHIRACPCAVRA